MRIPKLAIIPILALAAGTVASLHAGTVPPANPLISLSVQDLSALRGSGCQWSFYDRRGNTFIYQVENEFVVRTRAGRTICQVSDAQWQRFDQGRASVACGGKSLTLRPTGPVVTHEEADSGDQAAVLTVSQGGRSYAIRGRAGVAC